MSMLPPKENPDALWTIGWDGIYAVRADWGQASDSVFVWNEEDEKWVRDGRGRQVADFRHSANAALAALLRETAIMGGDDPDEDDDIRAEIDGFLESSGRGEAPEADADAE